MEQFTPKSPTERQKRINIALVAVIGQVGCITLLIALGAVFLGLWLDSRWGSRLWATVIMVVISIPASLIAMFAIVRAILKKLKPGLQESETEAPVEDPLGKEK